MILGTILVSLMTAACTAFLEPNKSEVMVTKYSLESRRRKMVTIEMVRFLQYEVRGVRGREGGSERWRSEGARERGRERWKE
jgi:hypothetical protein